MKRILPVVIIIMLASFGVATQAQMHHGKGGKMAGKMQEMKGKMDKMCGMGCGMGMMKLQDDKFLKKIGVSDTDRTAIRETIHKMKKDMMDIHFQMKEAHIALRDEYGKATLDAAKIDELNAKIVNLMKSKAELMLNTEKTVMMKLTPDQRAKLTAPMEGMKGMKGGKGGKTVNKVEE